MQTMPNIAYPCTWDYRLIGSDLDAIKQCVLEIVGHRPHSFSEANASSGGKFVSVHVAVEVETGDDRDALFLAFKTHDAIQVVL